VAAAAAVVEVAVIAVARKGVVRRAVANSPAAVIFKFLDAESIADRRPGGAGLPL